MQRLPSILIPPAIQQASGQPHLRDVLQQTIPPEDASHKTSKGHAETQFEHDLWQYFPGKVHTGLTLKHPNFAQPYIPDFVYIDPQLNLHIDIEIDEPYTYETRKSLHYLGNPKDEKRNQWFLEGNWVVIRFSEAQAVRSPASCCKAIAATIATIAGESSMMAPFRQIPTLKPENRWTQAEAQQMAERLYREQYLAKPPEPKPPGKRKRTKFPQESKKARPLMTANLTFYCPACGNGPIRWQGHYICCPNCSYDSFTL